MPSPKRQILLLWLSHRRDRGRVICNSANGADKVGIPVAGVIRLRNQRRNPEMVYVAPLTSVTCVVAP